jgi:photosystem II stability/assembly factor-like uncharacterized protein
MDTILFAATGGGVGVYRTLDYGGVWTPFNGGLTDLDVTTLGSNGSVLFAGTRTRGVFRWTVSGNWSFVFPVADVRAFCVLGSEVLVGAYGAGVFRSLDNGISWSAANSGLGSPYVTSLAGEGNIVLVGTNQGVFRSTNRGSSWSATNLTTTIRSLAVKNNVALAGYYLGTIYRSTDSGATWSPGFNPQEQVNAFSIGSMHFLAGTNRDGIYRSTDNGVQWITANTGLSNTLINGIATLDTTIVATSYDAGAFRTNDNGNTWISAQIGGPTAAFSSRVVFLVGTLGGVYRSSDLGQSWTQMLLAQAYSLGGRDENVFVGAFGQKGGYNLYLSTSGGSTWFFASANLYAKAFTVYDSILFVGNNRSTDNGATWTAMTLPGQVIAYGVHDSTLFSGIEMSGAYRSTDRGLTWTRVGFASNSVVSFVSVGRSLFAAALGVVHRTTNNGTTWTAVSEGISEQVGITSLAANRTYLFAGSASSGVWRRPLSQIVVGVGPEPVLQLPAVQVLEQNYPNPFNPATTIEFNLLEASDANLVVVDILGRVVDVLVSERLPAGRHRRTFDGRRVASGVYFYRLETSAATLVKKMLLTK